MLLVTDRERALIARVGPVLVRRFDDLVADWTSAWTSVVGGEPPADLPGLTRVAVTDGVEAAIDAQTREAERLVAAEVPLDRIAAAVLLWEEAVLRRLARDAVEDIFSGAAALNRLLHGLVLRCAEGYAGALTRSRDRLDRELADADRLKSELLSMVSHDLQTPLTTIQACIAELVDGDDLDDAQRRRFLELIARNADRLGRLITHILDVSKIEAHALDLTPEEIELRTAIPKLLEAVHPHADVRVLVGDDVPPVRADRDALERVLVNLVDNAVRFAPDGEPIRVEAERCGGDVEIRVVDRGPGVPVGRRAGLFSKFYQVDPSPSGRRTGSGLGLAIVRGLAEAMGGAAGFEPNAPVGATFWVRVPARGDGR